MERMYAYGSCFALKVPRGAVPSIAPNEVFVDGALYSLGLAIVPAGYTIERAETQSFKECRRLMERNHPNLGSRIQHLSLEDTVALEIEYSSALVAFSFVARIAEEIGRRENNRRVSILDSGLVIVQLSLPAPETVMGAIRREVVETIRESAGGTFGCAADDYDLLAIVSAAFVNRRRISNPL